ncbi:hypothetical protein VB737_07435, partial [Synechococcus sp. BA-120 BA3]|nr:hypothetical protein [Synechococcus sp. BA-120 BA3]
LDQRTRWEAGFVAIARAFAAQSLLNGIRRQNRKLFQLGLHLLVPPLALLLMLSAAVAIVLGIVGWWTGQWGAFAVLATALIVALVSVLINWMLAGHRWLGVAALLSLPVYVLWKIPVYLRIVKGGQLAWTRTERATEQPKEGDDQCR